MAVSRSLGQLTIDLIAKVGGWTSGLDKAERDLKSRTSRMERNLRSFRSALVGAFAAIGAGALVRSIVTETAAAERSLAQLDATLRSTGNAAGYSREQLVRMADDLSASSVFRSGDIIDAQSRLLTYTGIVGENLPRAMQAVVDYSAKFNVSLISAAESVGKAVERPLKGMDSLGKQGFYLSEQQKRLARDLEAAGRAAESQALVLEMLEESTEGAAAATRNTLGGALSAVRNGFSDLLTAKGGLSEATDQLNRFAELLRDPQTVEAANALTSAVIRFAGQVVGATAAVADLAKGIGEFFARAVSGPDFDDQVRRAKKELEGVQEVITRGAAELERLDPGTRYARMLAANIEAQRVRAQELQKQISSMSYEAPTSVAATSSGVGSSTTAPPPPSEAFLKLEAQLREQIALYGEVGQAAKIAYQIASGQLDDLSSAEQQRVLSLARQYDGIVADAAATRELQQAQERLIQTFDQQVANYERQIALTGEVTELDRIRYEIAYGGLVGINDEQRERLELLAEEVGKLQQIAKVQSEGAALTDSLRTPLEQYEAAIERFNELREQQAISDETYLRAVIKAQDDLKKATEETNEFLEQANRNVQDILASSIENNFRDGFKGIMRDFESMLTKMAAQAIAAQIGQKLFGGGGMGSGGGLLGGFLGGLFGGGRAVGGPVLAGHMYEVNERGPELLSMDGRDYLMMGRQSGQVIPNERIAPSPRPVNQVIHVTGSVSQKSARQLALEAAQAQRLAAMRLS